MDEAVECNHRSRFGILEKSEFQLSYCKYQANITFIDISVLSEKYEQISEHTFKNSGVSY